MQNWIKLLSGLLLAQLVLAVTVNLGGEEHGAFQAKQKLLAFDVQAVNGLRIEDGANSLLLEKHEGRWLLPDSGDFPADQASVQRLLDKLAGLEKGWPVATTGSAARRFKVADDEFQTRITLLADDETLAQLYVGTSPGFRKVHVRPADAEAVFSVAFNAWEASANADDWIDKEMLKLEPSEVARVELPGVVLQRKDNILQVTDLSGGEKTNEEAAASLIDKLAGLRIQSLLGREAKPEYGQDQSALELKLTRQDGEVLSYRFSKPQEGAYYVLKRSDLDDYFKIPEFSVQSILETNREKLVLSDSKESAKEAAAEEQQAAAPMETMAPTD